MTDQIAAPNGLTGIGQLTHLPILQAPFQPAVYIHMTAGAVIYLLNDLRDQPVIPAKTLGIHKGAEIDIIR